MKPIQEHILRSQAAGKLSLRSSSSSLGRLLRPFVVPGAQDDGFILAGAE